ncbi:hypothetical protein GCM10010468_69970 [Actinocorallia longicatena]|uniref:Uncharacterized protein n=1 Tax=Actinocorallia longicatena TaxID=111803 RepID=A0ABP6QLT2_9ACTN
MSFLSTIVAGLRLQHIPDYSFELGGIRAAAELKSVKPLFPLADSRGFVAVAGLLSSLYPMNTGEHIRIVWTVTAGRNLRPLSDDAPTALRTAAGRKQSSPLWEACGRVVVTARHTGRARLLLGQVLAAIDVLSGPESALRTRFLPSRVVAWRARRWRLPVALWPAVLNAAELGAVTAWPLAGIAVPGLPSGSSRQLPAPFGMRGGIQVGKSNHPTMEGRALTLAPDDRLRHVLIQGPTGAGKSELVASLALQDIRAGRGAIVIDPKNDLISSILTRIPESRLDDVILMDASAIANPVGFNLLGTKGMSEHGKELVVDRIVDTFRDLWASSWGPRTADVLRNCLLTLTHAKAVDGSAFTLAEIPELLTNDEFRRSVVRRSRIPDAVRSFWIAYEQMSTAERQQVIGPAMNKLRAFTTRTALRLILGQSEGINIGEVFRKRKILLVPLSQGVIGAEAAHLLGSLLVAFIWQETLSRTAVESNRRQTIFAYLDEFQEFIRFGGDINEMLAQARGLGLGLHLSYQYLDQLSPKILAAVLGTVRTQIVFQLEYKDAETLSKRFSPDLGRDDLTGLGAFEFAMRPCVNSRTASPVTGYTLPLPETDITYRQRATPLLRESGIPRLEVEERRRERLRISTGTDSIGRSSGGEEWKRYDG